MKQYCLNILNKYLKIFDRRYGKGDFFFKRWLLERELKKNNTIKEEEILKLFDEKFKMNDRLPI